MAGELPNLEASNISSMHDASSLPASRLFAKALFASGEASMGWGNGPPTWSEMERVLSGRAGRVEHEDLFPGDGNDSPAWSRKRGEYTAGELARGNSTVPYAELHAHSAFSFLDGASPPEELVEE